MAYRTRSLPSPRPISDSKGHQYGRRWSKVSKQGLAQQPICEDCLGPAELRHHEQPVEKFPEIKYAMHNHVSLCQVCHTERHRSQLVTTWRPRNGRFVIWGLPASGKTTLASSLRIADIWDQDAFSNERWGTANLTPGQIKTAINHRNRWIASQLDDCILICTSPHTAYDCGASLRAKMLHCWCPEHERTRRLEDRKNVVNA